MHADIVANKVGIYDNIREDVRRFSSVQPVDDVVLERTKTGWQGLIYSKRDAFLFVFDSAGFTCKPVDGSNTKIMQYAYRLVDKESAATRAARSRTAQDEQKRLNAIHDAPSTHTTGDLGVGSSEEKRFTGPAVDAIRRDLAVPRPVLLTNAVLPSEHYAAGGVIVNKEGKLLIVKPKGGYGGYDWTFPKGGLETEEYKRFGVDGAAEAALREVLEETGYSATITKFLSKVRHDDGGTCYYYAMKLDESAPVGTTDGEISDRKWVTATEALELLHEDDDIRVLSLATANTPKLVLKGLGAMDAPDIAKASQHSGAMVSFFLPKGVAKGLARPGGEPASEMHVTLAYLGKGLTPAQVRKVLDAVRDLAETTPPVAVSLKGYGRFPASKSSEGRDVLYLNVDSDKLREFRKTLVAKLAAIGVPADTTHSTYTPHVTLEYIPVGTKPTVKAFKPTPVTFTEVSVSAGAKHSHFKLLKQKLVLKALPKQSRAQKDAKNKKQGAKPIAATSKKAGAGGKTRYNYPGEKKAGPKPPQPKPEAHEGGHQSPEERPDTEMDPIVVPKDGKHEDPPKHTVDLAPLFQATDMKKEAWQKIAQRFAPEKMGKRMGFVRYMETHLKALATKYNLDADYFGLVYDVLTGANPGVQAPPSQSK